MARQPMDIRKRIERQEKKIIDLTDQLEQAKEEYEKLQEELKEQEKTEIFEAYQKSRRSYTEVIDFLRERPIFDQIQPLRVNKWEGHIEAIRN